MPFAYGDEVKCPKCSRTYSPTVHGEHECHISDKTHELIQGAPITLEQYKQFRGNSWEHEAVVPHLSNRALLDYAETITNNCSHNKMNTQRPYLTYDEVVMVVLIPELLKRLRRYEELLQRTMEAQSSLPPECIKDGDDS